MGIEWLSPAVLGGLVLVAVPIAIHLFARTPVTRVVVPSVRVIAQTTPRLRRRRRLLDPWLLAVRIVTVVAAVLASAGPLLVSRSREAGWARRTVRAIVVDGAVGAVAASPAIADERAGALDAEVIVAEPVDGGLARAVGWLSRQPPAQREVVVIGDAASTPGAAATAAIPADIGLRLRRVATGAGGDEGRVWLGATATGDGERAVRLAETREANGASVFATEPEAMPQLPVIATAATPADSALIAAVWEGVVAEGVFLRRRDTWQALEIEWDAGPAPIDASLSALTPDDRLAVWPLAQALAGDATAAGPASPWSSLAPDVAAARRRAAIVVRVSKAAEAPLAARLLRAAVAVAVGEREVPRQLRATADVEPGAFDRPAGGMSSAATRNETARDGRWLWLVAVGGLIAEQMVRRRRDALAGADRAAQAEAPAVAG